MRRALAAELLAALIGACAAPAGAECDLMDPEPNLPFPTLGGRQVWADVAWRQGWRVQQNALTGHFRLLDPSDVRRAWGSSAACRAALAEAEERHDLAPAGTHLVVLLHGLFRSRHVWAEMEAGLRKAGFDVAAIGYPSTRRTLEEHADQVAALLGDLPAGYERVSFVTHSLGGLVARALLARGGAWTERLVPARLVMIAPPSRGAALAGALEGFAAFRFLAGPAAVQATPAGAASLPAPAIPFAVIAGARGDGRGYNPLLEGDDDGVVRVDEARLEGAEETVLVQGLHSFLMSNEAAIAAAVEFLSAGDRRRR